MLLVTQVPAIPGINREAGEGKALLDKLMRLCNVPEYQARFSWQQPTDLLMWDNRCLNHYAVGDYSVPGNGSRVMDHCATLGAEVEAYYIDADAE